MWLLKFPRWPVFRLGQLCCERTDSPVALEAAILQYTILCSRICLENESLAAALACHARADFTSPHRFLDVRLHGDPCLRVLVLCIPALGHLSLSLDKSNSIVLR